MKPKKIALVIIVMSFMLFGAAFLTGCVSVPIPPTGDKAGDLGYIKISLKFQYLPKTQPDINWFNPIIPQPKLYKDK
jgi:hypothetical protein